MFKVWYNVHLKNLVAVAEAWTRTLGLETRGIDEIVALKRKRMCDVTR
jgi:hypothetical protein